MSADQFVWDAVRQHAAPYPPEAFLFVQEGLRATVEQLFNRPEREIPNESRHVSGQQLCMGLREFAIEQFGPMARTVLSHWNIHRTDDFGRIVFTLVKVGLMRKTEQDCIEDFVGVYDFDEVFGRELERC